MDKTSVQHLHFVRIARGRLGSVGQPTLSTAPTSAVSVDLPGTVLGVIAVPLPLVSGTADLSRRVVAVDAVEELCGFVIEVRLIVGGADDRAVSAGR